MPSIYVACLASYNAGIFHGKWIDAGQPVRFIEQEVFDMLDASPVEDAEEYAIHDTVGFAPLEISEFEDLGTVHEIAFMIEKHGNAFALYAEDVGIEFALGNFDEAYQGEYHSEEEFAEDFCKNVYTIPDYLEPYIAWDRLAEDLFSNSYSYHEGHVFRRM